MKHLALLGRAWVVALLFILFLSVWGYLLVCLGLHPEATDSVCQVVPFVSLFCSALIMARCQVGHKMLGLWLGILFVLIWFATWCYLLGRSEPHLWWSEGVRMLSRDHFIAWTVAVGVSLLGSLLGNVMAKRRAKARSILLACVFAALLVVSIAAVASSYQWQAIPSQSAIGAGVTLRTESPQADGTEVFLFSFDFGANPHLRLHLYDADSDDASPFDDANTSYMGQSIDLISQKLKRRLTAERRKLVCVFNAGFFGAHGDRVAHHEAALLVSGQPHYDVDLMRPSEQWCFFGVSSPEAIRGGAPRFQMISRVPFNQLSQKFETAIGGVRPIRISGDSVPLAPGIGSTSLRCSRTSIGWSQNGDELFTLIVRDPDSEGASNWQRKSHGPQSGGWDATEVQKFWEKQGVPNAVLLDGGESTQMAWQQSPQTTMFLRGGYHMCIPLGHWRDRPVLAFPAMLPRLQNYRGVLNYLFIDDEMSQ